MNASIPSRASVGDQWKRDQQPVVALYHRCPGGGGHRVVDHGADLADEAFAAEASRRAAGCDRRPTSSRRRGAGRRQAPVRRARPGSRFRRRSRFRARRRGRAPRPAGRRPAPRAARSRNPLPREVSWRPTRDRGRESPRSCTSRGTGRHRPQRLRDARARARRRRRSMARRPVWRPRPRDRRACTARVPTRPEARQVAWG